MSEEPKSIKDAIDVEGFNEQMRILADTISRAGQRLGETAARTLRQRLNAGDSGD